jgi:oxalate decarboxylase/phosphoglucose isomerase-like protein (cupin superfamily)
MTDGLPEQVQCGTGVPRPGVVLLDPAAVGYSPVLGGPPQTATMRAGSVVLQPGDAVGAHTTGDYEEVLVVLAGTGEMRLGDGSVLRLAAHCVAYCPPVTGHDVVNTGTAPLRYVYVVARAPGA